MDRVAEGDRATGPLSLTPRGCNLVACSLADHLPLEFGEAHEHVESQPSHRVGGGEVLGDGYEGSSSLSEPLHELREVEERPAQAVDLVDDDDIDLPGVDFYQKSLKGRPLDVSAVEAAVVVAFVDEGPARLLPYVPSARLPLGVEGVEVLLEANGSRLSGVDRAAAGLGRDLRRSSLPASHRPSAPGRDFVPFARPKKKR